MRSCVSLHLFQNVPSLYHTLLAERKTTCFQCMKSLEMEIQGRWSWSNTSMEIFGWVLNGLLACENRLLIKFIYIILDSWYFDIAKFCKFLFLSSALIWCFVHISSEWSCVNMHTCIFVQLDGCLLCFQALLFWESMGLFDNLDSVWCWKRVFDHKGYIVWFFFFGLVLPFGTEHLYICDLSIMTNSLSLDQCYKCM